MKTKDLIYILESVETIKKRSSDTIKEVDEIYRSIDVMIDQAMDYADKLEGVIESQKDEIHQLRNKLIEVQEKSDKYKSLLMELEAMRTIESVNNKK